MFLVLLNCGVSQVNDVDATYQSALAAGATSVQEPQQKDDADKRGGLLPGWREL